MKKLIKLIGNINIILGVLLLISPFVYLVAFVNFTPQVVASNGVSVETRTLSAAIVNEDQVKVERSKLTLSQRSFNNGIKIPSVGIDTVMYEGDESNLEKGVWIVPEHTTPDDMVSGEPVVIAAHRWGQDDLSYEFRAKNLFYHLPSTSLGDEIVIKWNDVDYRYRIIKKDEGEHVTQLADLILYTCKYYNSPERIFVYAERII